MSGWGPRDPRVVAWIEDAVGRGARFVSAEAMPASSTEKHLIRVEHLGSIVSLVLRRYTDAERLGSDPWYVVAHEARALELLEGTGVPAPRLFAVDPGAEVCDAPALLESRVPGAQAWWPDDLDAYVRDAAEVLVSIHAITPPADGSLPAYLPYVAFDGPADPVPHWSAHRAAWERIFELAAGPWPVTPARFIHRDYHPGNALWDGEQVSGVVDWASAASGPAGIDLARMRQNLAGIYGTGIADRFTACYVEAGGDPAARDPFWDLLDAADSVAYMDEPDAPGEGNVDGFESYVVAVLAEL